VSGGVNIYRRRLSNALAKLEAGDYRYLTVPDRDSYHTVWFELHQHLIKLLGLRAFEAAVITQGRSGVVSPE
jgi:hypothetical protein